jgi:putative solute:sodium symporter small subunit
VSRRLERFLGMGEAQVAPNAHPTDGAASRGTPRFPYLALLAWAFFTLVVPWAAQSLNSVDVLAFPLGFFMAAQGSLIALLLVAVLSARRQSRIGAPEDP